MADLIQNAVTVFLLLAFGLPLCLWCFKPDYLCNRELFIYYVYNLKVWQTLSAGFFVVGFVGYLAEGFEKVALEEWNVADDPRSLHIAASYEHFWCFAMVPWFVTGLGNAYLPLTDCLGLPQNSNSPAEQMLRAKLSLVWSLGMLGFWPITWWMTFNYDVQRPPLVIAFLGLLFVQTLVASILHLKEGRARARHQQKEEQGVLRVRITTPETTTPETETTYLAVGAH